MTLQFCTPVKDNHVDGLTIVKPPTFEAAINILLEQSKQKCAGYLNIRLDLPHRPRTIGPKSQNHRLNGFVSQFCESTGNDFDDIKLFVKRKAMRRGLPPKTGIDGKIIYSKVDGEPLPISEANMSIEQCSWVIEEIQQLAAEYSVTLKEE